MGNESGNCVGMSKFLAFLALVTFLLQVAAVANPYWLEKEFVMPPPAVAAMMGLPTSSVESNIGLIYACTDTNINLGIVNQDDYKCESLADIDSDRVADWQWAAAGMGLIALIACLISLLTSLSVACIGKSNPKLRVTTIIFYFISCFLLVAVLILFQQNTEIVISTQLDLKADYDFNWGYYVAIAGAGAALLMALLNICVSMGVRSSTTV